MIKQWFYSDFNIRYIFIPNQPDIILTSDGVLMNIHHLKRMNINEYNSFIQTNSKYDYEKSRLNGGKLVMKQSTPIIEAEEKQLSSEVDERKDINTKEVKEYKLNLSKNNKKETKLKSNSSSKPKKRTRKKKHQFNLFEDFGRYLMLLVSIGTGILSVFYTTKYLQNLNNPFIIALLLSSTMYLFGLFGINFAHTFRKRGNKGLSLLFLICGLTTLGASILSSADVNMSNYLKNVAEHEKVMESEKGQTLKVQILQDELSSNKEQIKVLQKDIETQSKVYVRSWSNELNDFVMVEGKITEVANTQINKDKEQIEQLQKRNTDINTQLMELADNGVSFVEGTKKSSISLSDVLGNLFHIKSEYVHLIILLFYSCFIDIISVLGLTAFYRLKEDDKK